MLPELFNIGPIHIYSFGLMMGLAFVIANIVVTKEFVRRGYAAEIASTLTIVALVFGVVGSKLAHILEHFQEFLRAPLAWIFDPSGLTFYGGFLLATIAIAVYGRIKKIPFYTLADILTPALAIGYGIGRIGCQLAGDGDYGIPSNLPWAMSYPHGTVPTLERVHPAPVYETIISFLLFWYLWRNRKKFSSQPGKLFALYLILSGLARLAVEFIRLNPVIMFGLTEAQLISITLVIVGIILLITVTSTALVTSAEKTR